MREETVRARETVRAKGEDERKEIVAENQMRKRNAQEQLPVPELPKEPPLDDEDRAFLEPLCEALTIWNRLTEEPGCSDRKSPNRLFWSFEETVGQLALIGDLFALLGLHGNRIFVLKLLMKLAERFPAYPRARGAGSSPRPQSGSSSQTS